MDRRGFFARIGTLIAGAAVATRVNTEVFKSKMFWSHEPMVGSFTNSDGLIDDPLFARLVNEKYQKLCADFQKQMNDDLFNGSATQTPRGITAWINDAK